MLEAADEHEPLAFRKRLAAGQEFVNRRQHHHARIGDQLGEQRLLERRDDQRHVRLANQRQLLVALGARRRPRNGTAFELGLTLRAQEMQVNGVEDDQRPGQERAHHVDMLDGNVVAGHHHHVELAAAAREDFRDRACIRMKQHFDAALLQLRHVGLAVFEVVGDEGDLAAERCENFEDGLHPQRARVVIGSEHARVDDEHAHLRAAVMLQFRMDAIRAVQGQRIAPLVGEGCLIHDLVALDARGLIRSGRLALEMNDRCKGLVVDGTAGRTHGEREIHIFVICGRVAGVEAPDFAEQCARDGEACARTVVGFAQVVVFRLVRVVVAAPVPRRSVPPDDSARLLQSAVRVDELRADQPRIRVFPEHRQDRIEPARRHDRVVVEEQENFSARKRRAVVACADETEIDFVAHELHAGHVLQLTRKGYRRRVVDHQDLDQPGGGMRLHAFQAGKGKQWIAEHGNHDRHAGRIVHRERERCDGRLRLEHRRALGLEPPLSLELAQPTPERRRRSLVAKYRPHQRREVRRATNRGPLRPRTREQYLRAMTTGANRRSQAPARRRLEFVDAMPRDGERRFVVSRADLHRVQRALRREQFGRKLLAIALRGIANRTKFLELLVHHLHAPLEFVPGLRMAAVDAGGKQLDQRQRRRVDMAFGEVIVTLVQVRKTGGRSGSAQTRRHPRKVLAHIFLGIHQLSTLIPSTVVGAVWCRGNPAAASRAWFHTAAGAFQGTVDERG